jgi:hypothetical protein
MKTVAKFHGGVVTNTPLCSNALFAIAGPNDDQFNNVCVLNELIFSYSQVEFPLFIDFSRLIYL